jgi:8-oxo-dGTP diphosphatase
MNAFESGERKSIPAVLIYARDERGRVLMIHRNGRPGDFHSGKWNGLGGKLEPGESPLEAAVRELREESGLTPRAAEFRALGTLTFPDFKPKKSEDWVVFVFTVQVADGPLAACEEGELHWVEAAQVPTLNLWEGDRHFIGQVLAAKPFLGTIWYQDGGVHRHWIAELG